MVSMWKLKAPPRVVVFGWLVLMKRILTVDKNPHSGQSKAERNICCQWMPYVFKRRGNSGSSAFEL